MGHFWLELTDTSMLPPSLGELGAHHMPALPCLAKAYLVPAQAQLAGKVVVKRYRQVTYPPHHTALNRR